MIKDRRLNWVGLFGSLILSVLFFTACNTNVPNDVTPTTESDGIDATVQADGSGENAEIIKDLDEIFDTSNEDDSTTDALPVNSELDTNGVPVGFTENGNPYRGNPNAPVVIEEFSDFQ